MKVLIAGRANSGQKEVLETLTSKLHDVESFAGYVISHTFQAKYFEVPIGIWTDEFSDPSDWVLDFTSSEAAEVRDALVLFLYTFHRIDPEIAKFVEILGPRCACYAIPQSSRKEYTEEQLDELIDMGFYDVLDKTQLNGVAGSVFYDALQDAENDPEGADSDSEADIGARLEPKMPETEPRDLEEIMAELRAARASTTMTDEEKQQLADRLAAELL